MRWIAVVLVLAALAVGGQGVAAAQAPSCLNVMPVSEVAAASSGPGGLAANGLTVTRGIVPEAFDVTVLGVLEDGIGPGMDMIIVEADSPALDGALGIWAGMSGSPVYADADGRLIGAVAYGLAAGPSMIGGLTAAEDMNRLLDLPAAPQKSTIQLSPALEQEVTATGAASAREAAAGLQRLPLPLSVSGLRAGRLPAFANVLGGRFAPYSGGTASAAPGDPAEIVPGGNFAAALSYGDVSAAGVGTTTARCGDSAIAFGHPMMLQGPTALSTHTATAITIQDDPTFVPFKIANVGGVVGTLDQDRLAGIRALLGPAPVPIDVISTVTDTGGSSRNGTTSVNRTADVPGIAFGHLLGNIDRVIDRIGEGTARVGWTVTGTAGGEVFSLSRNNRFADPADIAVVSSLELLDQLAALAGNEFAEVAFNGLTIDAALEAFRRYRITGIERSTGAAWVRVDPAVPVPATPGGTLRLRVLLAAYRSDTPIAPVELSFTIPQDAGGSEGSLDVRGGSAQLAEGVLPGGPGLFEQPGAADEPASFEELLTSLQDAPRGDDVVAELRLFGAAPAALPPVASVRRRVAEVVTGSLSIVVRVEGGEPPFGEPPFFEEPFPEFPEFEEEEEGEGPGRPRARLALGGPSTQKLGAALKRGVRITVRTNARGRLALRALLSRRAARRLELEKRLVGALSRRVRSGSTSLKLKLRRGARERLEDAGRVKLTINARFTSRAGVTRTDRFAVVLKRRAG